MKNNEEKPRKTGCYRLPPETTTIDHNTVIAKMCLTSSLCFPSKQRSGATCSHSCRNSTIISAFCLPLRVFRSNKVPENRCANRICDRRTISETRQRTTAMWGTNHLLNVQFWQWYRVQLKDSLVNTETIIVISYYCYYYLLYLLF